MRKFILSTVICALSFAGCASLPIYHPASKPGATGFSDQQLDDHHYRVSFQGDSSTTRAEVEDYLLFRAAELTHEKGYDYFIMTEKDTEAKTTVTTIHRPAFYGRYNHYYEHPVYRFPYYAYGYDWGYPYDTQTREYTRYSAITYISMHRGVMPESSIHAFNANKVIKNLGPIECWKSQQHDEENCKLAHPKS